MFIIESNVFGVPVRYVKSDDLGISAFYNRPNASIGVSLPSTTLPRWIRDKEALEKEATKKGVPIKVEIADNTPELQIKQIQNLISQGINVLIVTPTDSAAIAEAVENAKKAGVKVISYVRLVTDSDIDLFISHDNIRVGEFQGRFLVGNAPKGNYIIMSGDPNDVNAAVFKEGAMEFIRPLVLNRDIKIIAEQAVINWSAENAYEIVKKALEINKNKVNSILAPNDATAGGAIKALEEQGLAGKVFVTGQDADLDAIKRIIAGTQSMTVFKDTRELGRVAIDSAIRLASDQFIDANSSANNGKKIVPAILVLPVFVNKENIDDTVIKSGYWTKAEVYGKNIK